MRYNPLFSVLIANYNNGNFLKDAVDSVQVQSYINWEIIIVDDCSTDTSECLYKQLEQDSRIHIFYNEENKGCGFAKRRCVELSSGEICGFLDADDSLACDDAIQTMVEAHISNKYCSLIYSQYFYTDEKLKRLRVSGHQHTIPLDQSFLTDRTPGAISHFATFKKSFYKLTPGIDPIMQRAVDTDLYLKLEEVGKTLFIPTPLYCYRQNNNNISLGDCNHQKALYWEFIARYNACLRRKLPVEHSIFFFMDRAFLMSEEKSYNQGCNKIRKTKTYIIGRLCLSPLKWVERLRLSRESKKKRNDSK